MCCIQDIPDLALCSSVRDCPSKNLAMKPLFDELTAGFETLPPQLKEAARWVIDHPADVALLTMREQARRAGIPPATLTRLAQRFGLKGYDEIRKLYAEVVRHRPENLRGRAEQLLRRRDSEGDEALIQDIFSALTQHLQALSTSDSIERFTAAAEIIARSTRVFCLGMRSTFSVVRKAKSKPPPALLTGTPSIRTLL